MKKTMKIRGINLVYDDHGQGDVIVFIHGQPFNRSMWDDQVPDFSEKHRLIIPDLRGYGESGVTEGTVLLDELALDIIYLLEELGIQKAVFVGLSMGGHIVFDLYRLVPHLFRTMVLADTAAKAEDATSYENRRRLADSIEQGGMEEYTNAHIHQFISKHTFEHKPTVVAHLRKMMLTTNPIGSAAAQRGRAERRDHTGILARIHIPVAIFVGEDDGFTPVAVAESMHDSIPYSSLFILQHCGHISNMEQAGEFNRLLLEFLEEH
jgi:pimeloyl-ACP methyl ester carboxylesterase